MSTNPYFYSEITDNIKVEVEPRFMPEFSNPGENQYVWVYSVRITNMGADVVQLLSRYWYITDGNGNVHEVEGPGVVGEQPILSPGGVFTYQSSCPLNTNNGMMMGKYFMLNHITHNEFAIKIPAFSLDMPGANNFN